jgi:hypothetical protein
MQRSVTTNPDSIEIAEFLADEGFSNPEAAARARAVLEREGRTRPGKQRIAVAKVNNAIGLLRDTLARVCQTCNGLHPEVTSGREPVIVRPEDCEACAGSNSRRAARAAISGLRQAQIRDVLIVGGWPAHVVELREALGDPAIELRTIHGRKGKRSVAQVERDLSWADVLVVWSETPLDHALSELYTRRAREGRFRTPAITVKGGVEALCNELTLHALLQMASGLSRHGLARDGKSRH